MSPYREPSPPEPSCDRVLGYALLFVLSVIAILLSALLLVVNSTR
jgi:hypothetical protein